MPGTIPQTKRVLSNSFRLDLDGVNNSLWKSVSGLEISLEVVDDPSVSPKGMYDLQRLPGQVTYTDLTLTRGFSEMDMYKWFTEVVVEGKADDSNRKNGSVTALASDMKTEVAAWEFIGSWPLSIEVSDVEAGSSELMIETITLVIESLKRTK